jgi:hypothetical protein
MHKRIPGLSCETESISLFFRGSLLADLFGHAVLRASGSDYPIVQTAGGDENALGALAEDRHHQWKNFHNVD